MNEEVLADFRNSLKKILTGVEDSDGWSGWDTTPSNSSYRNDIKKAGFFFINRLLESDSELSLLKEYSYCYECKDRNEKLRDLLFRKTKKKYTDDRIIETELVNNEKSVCKCGESAYLNTHFKLITDCKDKKKIYGGIFWSLSFALKASADRKPRAAIREELMLLILELEEMILGESIDSVIKKRIKELRSKA